MSEVHKKIVQEIIEEEKIKPGTVAINLFGSVAHEDEKFGSDVDIEIVSENAKKWSLENMERYGIKIDFEIYPKRELLERVKRYPYLCYIYLESKTVFDPTGFMKKINADIKKYFKDNPDVKNFWEEKQQIKKDLKKKGLDGGCSVKFCDEAEILFSKEHKVTRTFFRGKR